MTERCGDGISIEGPDDSGALRRFGARGFAVLWRHERVLAADLAEDANVILTLTSAGRLEIDNDGILVAVHGLVARPTRHRIDHDGSTTHTWCALDAIGIPAALGITADAVTSCPSCNGELRVHIRKGIPIDRDGQVLWLPESSCDHLVNDFCSHANLYCSPAHLATTVRDPVAGSAITVTEVADIGRHIWVDAAKVIIS